MARNQKMDKPESQGRTKSNGNKQNVNEIFTNDILKYSEVGANLIVIRKMSGRNGLD